MCQRFFSAMISGFRLLIFFCSRQLFWALDVDSYSISLPGVYGRYLCALNKKRHLGFISSVLFRKNIFGIQISNGWADLWLLQIQSNRNRVHVRPRPPPDVSQPETSWLPHNLLMTSGWHASCLPDRPADTLWNKLPWLCLLFTATCACL